MGYPWYHSLTLHNYIRRSCSAREQESKDKSRDAQPVLSLYRRGWQRKAHRLIMAHGAAGSSLRN